MDSSSEIRQKFLKFFESRRHKIVPSSSLIPADSSVLFTTAGMQQFKPYFLGGKSPYGPNVASIQKCVRTSDIDEVGDASHLTFFEMMGNFSFGGYFKKEAIEYAYEFIAKEMKLKIDYVTVFDPEKIPENDWRKSVPFDKESYDIWKNEIGLDESRIRREGIDNFWGPTGNEGPCGPTTEIYCEGMEIWNLVFNEYLCDTNKKLTPLKQKGVDTGMGFERLVMVLQGKSSIFETDLFDKFMALLPPAIDIHTKRIIADHSRAVIFLISDGILPSNKDRGYILRRLLRRLLAYQHLNYRKDIRLDIYGIVEEITKEYKDFYTYLDWELVVDEIMDEAEKFSKTLEKGLKKFNEFVLRREPKDGRIGVIHDQRILYGKEAFYLYQTFGFPKEIMQDLCKDNEAEFDEKGFEAELKNHQQISRAGAEKKFGGHGVIAGTITLEHEKMTKLHTATHLLHQALREILGNHVQQMGSDINPERLRFDFSHPEKLSKEQIQKVENIVNQKIRENLPVIREKMKYEEAVKSGALAFFKEKYPEEVFVYSIGEKDSPAGVFSKEICAGPHVSRTGELGNFKILKEEASSAGVRRIRAFLQS